MDAGGFNWAIIIILGPLLMVIVFAYAMMKNRKAKSRPERTEQATRDLYRQEDAAHRDDNTMGT